MDFFFLAITNTVTSQNTDLSSWMTLYLGLPLEGVMNQSNLIHAISLCFIYAHIYIYIYI
jgi:hypothetical protein